MIIRVQDMYYSLSSTVSHKEMHLVAPVTGPHVLESADTADSYVYRLGWRQAKPRTLPLEYFSARATTKTRIQMESFCYSALPLFTNEALLQWEPRDAKAYSRLKDKLSDRASLGVSLAEADQSLSMMRNRVLQLYRFGRHLRRGDFSRAAAELKTPVPKRVSKSKSMANNYLEFHFGWDPLIKDIHSVIDVLQSPFNSTRVRGSSKTYDFDVHIGGGEIDEPWRTWPSNHYTWWESAVNYEELVSATGCEVAVTNHNLWLANQLGLVNPAIIAYELIPFSFVLDWFVNVEQFLSSGTDFYGLTVENPWRVRKAVGEYRDLYEYEYHWFETTYPPGSPPFGYTTRHDGAGKKEYRAHQSQTDRQVGLISPALHIRPWKMWGWRKAAAAVSLLVQQLKRV